MTFTKKILASSVLIALSSSAFAGSTSANATLTSDYLWRGATQTTNAFAFQAGADYDTSTGLTAGVWYSNVDFGTATREIDLYAGYDLKAGDIDLSLGFIHYDYDDSASNFDELSIYSSTGDFSYGYIHGLDTAASSIDLGYSTSASGMDISGNYYLGTGSGATNTFQISVSKDVSGVSIATILGNDGTNTSFAISASKSFDL